MSKIAVITGASMGIGKALTHKMLDDNYTVIGTSRTGQIDIDHPNFYALKLDLSMPQSIADAQDDVFKNFDHIDILVNNAGIGPDLHCELPERDSFDRTFDVNVKGLVFFTEPLVKFIKPNGKIINITSKMGSLDVCIKSSSVAYRMSKSALNMYTKILSNRLEDKIKVACIHPGWVKTTIIESNLIQAPLTPEESADRICNFLSADFKHGIYWDCEEGVELPW